MKGNLLRLWHTYQCNGGSIVNIYTHKSLCLGSLHYIGSLGIRLWDGYIPMEVCI